MTDSDSDDLMQDASSVLDRFRRRTSVERTNREGSTQPQEKAKEQSQRNISNPSQPSTPVNESPKSTQADAHDPVEASRGLTSRPLTLQLPRWGLDIDRDSYKQFDGWDTIIKVLREIEGVSEPSYKVRFGDNHNDEVCALKSGLLLGTSCNTYINLNISLLYLTSQPHSLQLCFSLNKLDEFHLPSIACFVDHFTFPSSNIYYISSLRAISLILLQTP